MNILKTAKEASNLRQCQAQS